MNRTALRLWGSTWTCPTRCAAGSNSALCAHHYFAERAADSCYVAGKEGWVLPRDTASCRTTAWFGARGFSFHATEPLMTNGPLDNVPPRAEPLHAAGGLLLPFPGPYGSDVWRDGRAAEPVPG
jgi:hypothetical protein